MHLANDSGEKLMNTFRKQFSTQRQVFVGLLVVVAITAGVFGVTRITSAGASSSHSGTQIGTSNGSKPADSNAPNAMPYVLNSSTNAAEAQIESTTGASSSQITVQVIDKSQVDTSSLPSGTVMAQIPIAGESVSASTEVILRVSP
jgi:hypothetical protein